MTKGKLEQFTPLSKLPSEILQDILSRLSVNDLCRFRCVSKSWWDLVNDPHFIKIHIHQSIKNNPKIILASHSKIFSMDFEPRDGTSATELNLPFGAPIGRIKLVGCCNGLVCFNDEDTIYVWNPATREHIKWCDNSPVSPLFARLGFGYHPVTGEYKVLKFVDSEYIDGGPRIDVRTLGENSWRRLSSFPYNLSGRGVLLNGALHFVANHDACLDQDKLIVCFDLRDEKFREMLMPDFANDSTSTILTISEGLLCIFRFVELSDYFEIWEMKEYGDEKSWTKQFSEMQMEIGYLEPLAFRKSGEILVQDIDESIALYNPMSKRIKDFHIRGIPCVFNADNHLESLVSPVVGNVLNGK